MLHETEPEEVKDNSVQKKTAPKFDPDKFVNDSPLHFSNTVYENLPPQLRDICMLVEDRTKRDVLLIGLITASSAAFSRCRFLHGSGQQIKEYSPHLLSFVTGGPGSGKGMAEYGSLTIRKLEERAEEINKDEAIRHKIALAEYQQEKDRRKKSKEKGDVLLEPEPPVVRSFMLSASDTTQAALVQVLHNNPRGGFAFDTEADTLVQSDARKDFGGFSDIIRKVFHHEQLSRQRMGKGETYNVLEPRLALLLCGTPDQAKKLIKDECNGLFSRLWYYSIPDEFSSYKRMRGNRDIVGERCVALQKYVYDQSQFWIGDLLYFEFTEEQETDLEVAMQDKETIEQNWGRDIGASWNRMAIIVKRIAVTLAAFQGVQGGPVSGNAWKCAIHLLPTIKAHCLEMINLLRAQTDGKISVQRAQYEKLKASGLSDEKIAKEFGCDRSTIKRRKEQWHI